MNEARPQELNDDFIRTWTISGSRDGVVEFTIKLKHSGAVTPLFFAKHNNLSGLKLLGFGGEFTQERAKEHSSSQVWMAAGSGVTPFLAMLEELKASSSPGPAIRMLLATRRADLAIAEPFLRAPAIIKELNLFITDGSDDKDTFGGAKVFHRRPNDEDVVVGDETATTTYFVCGPDGFLKSMLKPLNGRGANVVTESFAF